MPFRAGVEVIIMPFRAGIEVIIIPDRKRENDNQRAIYPKMVAMYQKSSSIVLFALILAVILLAGGVVWHGAASVHAQTAPVLTIASGLSVQEGETVTVPIAFEANGNAIAAMAFSIDYDERCLALDLTDEDTNGVPDSVTFDLPAGIFASLTPDLDDADGELDFIIADYFPPFVTLQDSSALLTLTFNTICMPPDGNQVEAAIRFSASPSASFGGPQGNSLTGTTIDGMVTIVSNVPPTPTHTPTPSATATPTIVPTEPPTTPTATPTFVPTAPPQTIVDYFEAQSQQDGVMLKWQTSQEVNTRSFTVHRLTLGQTGGFAQLTGERASQGTGGSQYTYFDNSVEPATTYTYLLVEEKMNGRRIAYYDLIATVDPVIGTGNQPADRRILLPLIMK